MAFEKYVKVPGSEREPMAGGTQAGSLDPNEVMQVTLALRPRALGPKQESSDKLVASGKRLSREEYEARYGADPADVQQVERFATAHGLALAQVNLAARTVVLTGRCADCAKAFQVQLARYEYEGGSYRGRAGPVNIPEELNGVVHSVHGLDNRPQAQTHYRVANSAAGPLAAAVSYTALQVAQAYSFPTAVNGQGQTIGIIELGGGFTQSDLQTYFSGLGISPLPTVLAVSVDGAQNQPTGDTSGPDTEVMLDIEVAGAVAPGATIAVYFAPNTDAGFLDAINQAVMDTVNRPSVISISWGGPESSWTAQSLQSYNSALQSASAVGVTVCVAAGDNGSTDGVSDGLDHVDFPASSPYSLACGGTTLDLSNGSITSEVVWNDLPNNGATGGGVSETFPIPSWQANANVPPSDNPGNFKGRGLPDVAGDADPETGYQVQVDGSSFVVGGTSAVAPLWAGLIALFNQSLGAPVGYVAVYTGLRVSELVGLRWNDVNVTEQIDGEGVKHLRYTISIDERFCRGDWGAPKSESSNATIGVNECVYQRIQRLKQLTVEVRAGRATRRYKVVKSDGPEDLVFQSVRTGSPMRDNNILTRHIKPAARKIGLGFINWRCLRTSHATWLKMVGADVKDAQAQMRHSRASTTMDIYQQFVPESQQRVVDKLSSLSTMVQ
jgi:kumamolisin